MNDPRFFPMQIGGVGLCCAHDMDTSDAFRAIAAGKSMARRHPVFVGADGLKQLCAPVAALQNERDTVLRLCRLAGAALADLGAVARRAQFTVLLLPKSLGPQSPLHDATSQAVAQGQFGFSPSQVIYGGTDIAVEHMLEISHQLHRQEIADCLLVCADTLLSPFALDLQEVCGKPPVRSARHVPLPGELGIALYFRPAQGRGRTLAGLATGLEPFRADDPERGLMGRSSVTPLRAMGEMAPGTKLIVDADGPRHKAEELGVILTTAVSVQEADMITPSASLGAVGCATLPLFIGLAHAVMQDAAPGIVGWISDDSGIRIALRVI